MAKNKHVPAPPAAKKKANSAAANAAKNKGKDVGYFERGFWIYSRVD